MTSMTIEWSGNGVARITTAVEALAGTQKHKALQRAVNHVGAKTFTQTKRSLAKQMGVTQKALTEGGRTLTAHPAYGGDLSYHIRTGGRAMRLKAFKPNPSEPGARPPSLTAAPWGNRRAFKRAFWIGAGAKWGLGAKSEANIYMRLGKKRFPVKSLYGPNLNKELVKDTVAANFFAIVRRDLPARVAHEINVITRGIVA